VSRNLGLPNHRDTKNNQSYQSSYWTRYSTSNSAIIYLFSLSTFILLSEPFRHLLFDRSYPQQSFSASQTAVKRGSCIRVGEIWGRRAKVRSISLPVAATNPEHRITAVNSPWSLPQILSDYSYLRQEQPIFLRGMATTPGHWPRGVSDTDHEFILSDNFSQR
jgi:hypothetical protein